HSHGAPMIRFQLILSFIFLLALVLPCASAQSSDSSAAKPALLVANQGDRDLSIIDPKAGQQVAAVPEGGITGHEVAASPDGRTAYVPIYGNSGVGKPGTDGRNMVVIDISAR